MSKLNKGLMILIAIGLVFAVICQVGLMGKIIELNNQITKQSYKIANKDLQLSILWQEINSSQKINAELNNKNSELRGYTNFLESQNAMLLDREAEGE